PRAAPAGPQAPAARGRTTAAPRRAPATRTAGSRGRPPPAPSPAAAPPPPPPACAPALAASRARDDLGTAGGPPAGVFVWRQRTNGILWTAARRRRRGAVLTTSAAPTARRPPGFRGRRISWMDDCWSHICIAGAGPCAELPRVAHCRNCEVYARAGRGLLERTPPAGYLEQWALQLAAPPRQEDADTLSAVLFRIASERFALPTA